MNPTQEASSSHFDYCSVLGEMVAEGKTVGRSGRIFDDLAAISTVNNLVSLRRMMLEYRPERTLEVGLSYGGSALVFTTSHRDLGHTPNRQHKALDPFQAEVWDDSGVLAVERAGLDGWLEHVPLESAIGLPQMLAAQEHFDMIYIDGSHLFEDVFVDAHYAIRLLAPGGVVAFDDSQKPQVAKAIRFLKRNLRSGLAELDLGRFRLDGGRSLKYRLSRQVGRIEMTAFQRVGETIRSWDSGFVNF